MPTEKNAAFLPMQYGFKLDRQRVKVNEYSLGLTSFFFPEWLECHSCSHFINFFTLLRSPCCPMICFVDRGLYLSAHRECGWGVLSPAFEDGDKMFWFSIIKTKEKRVKYQTTEGQCKSLSLDPMPKDYTCMRAHTHTHTHAPTHTHSIQ